MGLYPALHAAARSAGSHQAFNAAAASVAALAVALAVLPSRPAVVVSDLGLLAAALVATAACGRRSFRESGLRRVAWSLLGLSAASWALGQTLWSHAQLVVGRAVPFPSAADVAFLAAGALLVAGLMAFPVRRRTSARLRIALDAVAIATGSFFVAWWAVLSDTAGAAGGGPLWYRLLGLSYPALRIVQLAAVLFVARRGGPDRAALRLIGAGVTVLLVTELLYAELIVEGAYQTGHWIDAGWAAGLLLVGLAAGAPTREGPRPHDGSERVLAELVLPYLPATVVVAIGASEAVSGNIDVVQMVVGVLCLGAVLLRQVLLMVEHVALHHHLEERVEERTAQLTAVALRDPLTGLWNRRRLRERASAAEADRLGLVLVNLDGFRALNDAHGHRGGDKVLIEAARLLERTAGAEDLVVRLGGDEFAVLVAGGGQACSAVAERVAEQLRRPVTVAGQPLRLHACLGIAAPETPQPLDELLQGADIAMQAAKGTGKGQVRVFDAELQRREVARRQLRADLVPAVERDELTVHYQPLVSLASGDVIGFEALARWLHPVHGFVPPDRFIPMAEESGLILDIGRTVLRRACRQALVWRDLRPGAPPTVSVNLSMRQFHHPGLVESVAEVLAETEVDPALITLELTESGFAGEDAIQQLHRLRGLGVRLAIDDFGTGYSSLAYLRRLPVDTVKIDRALVVGVAEEPREWSLVRAILDLIHTLGMRSVAEGIEHPEQMAHLRALGCQVGQGYYYARPAPPELCGLPPLRAGTVAAPVGAGS